MYRYVLNDEAKKELEREIRYSRDNWGVRHASKYRRELMSTVRKISQDPKIHALKTEFGEGLRAVRHKGNNVVYMVDDEIKLVTIVGFPSVYKNISQSE